MAKPVLGKSVRSDWFFLGRDFAVRTFSMETVQAVYFCLEQSRQIQTLQPKQRKKMWILLFFIAKLQEKVKKIAEFLLRRQTFSERGQYYPQHLETFDAQAETGIDES